jgi:WD40 repeat protein
MYGSFAENPPRCLVGTANFGDMGGSDYDVFISYARAVSTPLAVDLQRELERFAKRWNQVRALRVFRDDSSMSASPSLWSSIEAALTTSKYLILIATPEAAASPYVDQEVRWWLQHKGADSILLVLGAGKLTWSDPAGGFTPDSVVPPALQRAFAEEPRWIDMTWFDDPDSTGSADPRFQERVADLAAPVRGVDRDALIGANLAEHRKTMRRARIAIAALSTLLVAALVAGGVAVTQRNTAKRLFADSVGQRIAPEAARILNGEIAGGIGRGLQEILVAQQLKTNPDSGAYLNAMFITAGIDKIATTVPAGLALSAPAKLIATGSTAHPGDIQIFDTDLKAVGLPIQTGNDSYPKAISHDGRLLAAGNDSGVVTLWDVRTGARKGAARLPVNDPDKASVFFVMFTEDDKGLVVRTRDNSVWFYSVDPLQQTAPPIPNIAWVTAPVDGSAIAVAPLRGSAVEIRNPWTGDKIGEPIELARRALDVNSIEEVDLPSLFFDDCASFDDTGNRLLVQDKVFDLASKAPVESWSGISGDCSNGNADMSPDGTEIIRGGDSVTILTEGDAIGAGSKQLSTGGPYPIAAWLDPRRALAFTREGFLTLALDPWSEISASAVAIGAEGGDVAVQGSAPSGVSNAAGCSPQLAGFCTIAFHGGSAVRPARPIDGVPASAGGANGDSFYTLDRREGSFIRWRFQDGSRQQTLPLLDDPSRQIACSLVADGGLRSLAVNRHAKDGNASCERGGGTIRSWDLTTGRQRPDLQVPENVQINSFTGIDGAKLLALIRDPRFFGDGKSLWSFDLDTGTSRLEYEVAGEIADVESCRDSGGNDTWMIAETNGDVGFVKGALTQGITWPKVRIQGDLRFAQIRLFDDCRVGATGGGVSLPLQFWDVSTGTPFGSPIPDAELLGFSPDEGRMGVTVGSTKSLRIIPARPTAADLCAKLTSNMSRKQWNEWISPDLDYQKACPELPIASDD